jgi:hypothetical protein
MTRVVAAHRLLTAFFVLSAWGGVLTPHPSLAQTSLAGDPLPISRLTGPVAIDGALTEEAWQRAEPVDRWYETNPGDNVEPAVRSVGYLAFDDRFLYAAFEFDDPAPGRIRAPLSDRDQVSGNATDYAGVILDTRNDGRTAVLLLVTPRGVQYDADTDDASGEDSAPDYFWDAAARITDRGWTLEIRVPFSSLRYRSADPQRWNILLYRNYPRDFRYQMFSARLPRGGNCFICRANPLTGLEKLPGGGHVVAAPYLSGARAATPVNGLGTPLDANDTKPRAGIDVKWTANADTVLDFTANPDFSQIESDTAQIATNERFALFFSEKRPFFLEGVNLFRTPIQAVHTRTITAPRWGGRLTGRAGGLSYTALVAEDKGGGSIVLPGAAASNLADQTTGAMVVIARARRDVGSRSFVSLVATSRDGHDGHGSNRVVGPDFQWRWRNEVVTGQWLVSSSRTPARPDLAREWTGQRLSGHALNLSWSHSAAHFDARAEYKDLADGFRADLGFVPQVGVRDSSAGAAWTFRPTGFVRRARVFLDASRQADRDGGLVAEQITPGVGLDVKWTGFLQVRAINDRSRAGDAAFTRRQLAVFARFNPSRRVAQLSLEGLVGREIDFANARLGRGASLNAYARLNPTDHLEIEAVQNQRVLHVDDATGAARRLFVSRVSRLRGTYMVTASFFVRAIGQYVSTSRDPSLYLGEVDAKSTTLSASALVAYKINWQSVLFVGYGDDREFVLETDRLHPASRQFFVKLSYAFQR